MASLTDLQVPSIRQADAEAAPVAATVGSLIASIAGGDGVLTPREYAAGLSAAEAVAGLSDDPAVVRSLTLRAFEAAAQPLGSVLKELVAARAKLPEPARRPLLEALFPLLATQGDQARPLARKIAEALELRNVEPLLLTSDLPVESSNVKSLLRLAGNAFSKSPSRLELAQEVVNFTGDEQLMHLLQSDRHDRDQHLDQVLGQAIERLRETVIALHHASEAKTEQLELAHSLERSADDLERQFKARLRAIEKRVLILRRHVKDDIDELSEGGGDEAEVDLRRMSEKRGLLLRNDDRDVRERMISKSFARRHDKMKRRHDEQIQLLRDELAEYRDDFIEAAKDTVAPISLAEWRLVIPGATTGARVKDALDQGATRTLAVAAVGTAGAAGAVGAGLIGSAAVMGVVVAPVGLAVASVVAAAGVWKLYANRGERLRTEQRARAQAIRTAAHSKAEDAFVDVSAALDEVADGFRQVSLSRISPIRQDAERIREMCNLQSELCRRISLDAQHRLEQWGKSRSTA